MRPGGGFYERAPVGTPPFIDEVIRSKKQRIFYGIIELLAAEFAPLDATI